MKKTDGSAPASPFPESSETAEQERNIAAPQGQLANPSTFNPSTGQQTRNAGRRERESLLAREGQAIEEYSLKS